MKVFLLVPPALKSGSKIPDLGLAYIATALRKQHHDVELLQAETDYEFTLVRDAIRKSNPDVIGIKVYSLEIKSVKITLDIIREELPDIPIVLGGPHISIAPEDEMMEYFSKADYAIRGEGEVPFPKLLDFIQTGEGNLNEIPGLVYRQDNAVLTNEIYIHKNLDDFDYPAWDLIDPRKHEFRWFFWTPEHPGAPFLTNRGCPYRCTFCSQNVVTGKSVRYRSLEHVFEEMELLQQQYGVYDYDFIDDNFLMDPAYVRAFCEGVLKRGWKIRWNCCGARLDFVDLDLALLMEKAGCNVIACGFENGNQRMLDYMKKDLDLDMTRVKTKMITKNTKIKLFGLFILGYPTETEEEIRRTIRHALDLPLIAATFNTYILLPGNEEYVRMRGSGDIEKVPWERLSLDAHVYAPKGLTLRKLKYYYWLAYFSFFSRPRVLWPLMRYSWRKLPIFFLKASRKFLWKKSMT